MRFLDNLKKLQKVIVKIIFNYFYFTNSRILRVNMQNSKEYCDLYRK